MSIPVLSNIPPRTAHSEASPMFDVRRIRDDFPILRQKIRGKPLVYLDNAATAQKPRVVLDALQHYYTADNANIHRGVHLLSERATQEYENARAKVRDFLHAADEREIIFVRGATEGINLVAQTYGRKNLREGDEVLITTMEHHSNIVPWQMVCEEKGAVLRVAPINDDGELLLDEFEKLLTPRTRIVSVVHVSNSLGTVNPVKRIVGTGARPRRCWCWWTAPNPSCTGRSMCATWAAISSCFPAISCSGRPAWAILYGREALLEAMPPYQGGGDMIRSVSFDKRLTTACPTSSRRVRRTSPAASALAPRSITFKRLIGRPSPPTNTICLLMRRRPSRKFAGLRLIGTAREKAARDFVHAGRHPSARHRHDPRSGRGRHPHRPSLYATADGLASACRPRRGRSFAFYNTREEIDALVDGIHKVREMFG